MVAPRNNASQPSLKPSLKSSLAQLTVNRHGDRRLAGVEELSDEPAVGAPPAPATAALQRIAQGRYRWIDRRQRVRTMLRVQVLLSPLDATGAVRSPVIYARDVDEAGMGFLARQDVSVMVEAELCLPPLPGSRRVRFVPCTLRRCREWEPGWFEGYAVFAQLQPLLAASLAE